MVSAPQSDRGAALVSAVDIIAPQQTLAAGAGISIPGPGVLAAMFYGWTGGAVHWQLFDGVDATGTPMWDMSFTSTSAPRAAPFVFSTPLEFKTGLFFKNDSAAATITVMLTGQVGGGSRAVGAPRSVAIPSAKARAFLGVAAGSGVVVSAGGCALTTLNMRTTPGSGGNSIVKSYDGTDTNGIFVDSNLSLSNSGNSFDKWIAAGLRLKHGLFLSNEGTFPVDILIAAIVEN